MAQSDTMFQALRKILMALQGTKRNPVVVGALAVQAWGAAQESAVLEMLIAPGEQHRQIIFSAARGEGFQTPDPSIRTQGGLTTLLLRYSESGGPPVTIEITEASTPYLAKVLSRASERAVLKMPVPTAAVEDVILLKASSTLPHERGMLVELLKRNAAAMDAQYLKREAEGLGVFDKVKAAWQEAKKG